MAQKDVPIACTLGAGDYQARVQWLSALNRRALVQHERRDLTLELKYEAAAADQVEELVRRERACCAFLSFELVSGGDSVQLTITAPDAAREAADTLFAAFVAKDLPAPASTCGCC